MRRCSCVVRRAPILQAWALVHGHKTIENRSWTSGYTGLLAIHASGVPAPPSSFVECRALLATLDVQLPDALPLSAFVGVVHLDDATSSCTSPLSMWALRGERHWRVSNARAFDTPIPASGRVGIWRPSAEDEAAIRSQLR